MADIVPAIAICHLCRAELLLVAGIDREKAPYLGQMRVLCGECAKTHEIRVEEFQPGPIEE